MKFGEMRIGEIGLYLLNFENNRNSSCLEKCLIYDIKSWKFDTNLLICTTNNAEKITKPRVRNFYFKF